MERLHVFAEQAGLLVDPIPPRPLVRREKALHGVFQRLARQFLASFLLGLRHIITARHLAELFLGQLPRLIRGQDAMLADGHALLRRAAPA